LPDLWLEYFQTHYHCGTTAKYPDRPRLYAPKCLSIYNSVVIRGASQMPRIICIVIPSARPRDLYCAAWRDGMQLTHIWSLSLRIRNAWVVTVVTASRYIFKNLIVESKTFTFLSECNYCSYCWKKFHHSGAHKNNSVKVSINLVKYRAENDFIGLSK